MSSIDSVALAPGTQRIHNDVKLFGAIRTTNDRFGTGERVGSIRLPDFKKSTEMYTKTEPTRSDEEIKEDIARIAREDSARGYFHSTTKEYWDLKKEYISSVSPDREGIVTKATKEIFANLNMAKQKPEEAKKTLLELVMNIEKKGDKKNQVIDMSCSTYNACFENGKLTYAGFKDMSGKVIADYSPQNGWSGIGTEAEGVRLREFCATYNAAWESAEAEKNTQKAQPKHLEGGTAFDAYA